MWNILYIKDVGQATSDQKKEKEIYIKKITINKVTGFLLYA